MVQAGVYSAVLHYLKAVARHGRRGRQGAGVDAPTMKAMPTDDDAVRQGQRSAPDGRKIHPIYLFEVKSPAESKGPWDYYKLLATIPAEEAFRPLAEGGCPLVQ